MATDVDLIKILFLQAAEQPVMAQLVQNLLLTFNLNGLLPNAQSLTSVPQSTQTSPVGNQPKQTYTPSKHTNTPVHVYHRPARSSDRENQQDN
ncbi:hypothetical protein P5G65_22615 [Paenibacillus chondroitinus]|uniref:Uncharacterized protein n=1 Tax=Paenibacillus chondroitinus TaxID=59842 RepID=A0ABU6DG15_9BACL|nr:MULTISPECIES: hypothetical protein [Paenibacillus]MCY9662668.1 hypothetical protein [Paenibacillus anseongense]MEB4796707.1 hypothetical protein [Paenibacillus chondroitinus]